MITAISGNKSSYSKQTIFMDVLKSGFLC